jgi:hypothetical protein
MAKRLRFSSKRCFHTDLAGCSTSLAIFASGSGPFGEPNQPSILREAACSFTVNSASDE